jgi:thiol-disulfide isomerase/thioredoxin
LVDGASQDGVSCLVWQPHGSTISSALHADAAGKVVYRDPPAPSKVNAAARANVRNRVAVQQPGLMRAVMRAVTTPTGRKPAKEKETIDGESLWLRAGDHFPCNVVSIDERGVTFKSTYIEKTFVPHDQIKAWERIDRERLKDLEDPKRGRLLTLPRMQRSNPPTHLIQSTDGDFLRAQLTNMDAEHLNVGVRLEPKQLSRDSIARVIWFHKDETPELMKNAAKKPAPDASSGEETETDDAAPTVAESPPAVAQADGMRLQAVRTDGVRLTFTPEKVSENSIHGQSDLLGACHVDLKAVDALLFGAGIDAAADELAYHDWRLHSATDPRFVTEDGKSAPSATGTESALVGKPAPEFELDMLDGKKFRLNEERGKIVVLDFWASWCGPCMQAMPQIHAVTDELKDQGVRLVAVNLQEDHKTAADTLERLGFAADVALDIDGAAAGKYQVTAIPQTVIVDREGKVARLFIGGGPTFADDLRKALQEVIAPPATDAPEKVD